MKKLIYKIINYSGINNLAGRALKQRLYVFNFHSISDQKNSNELMTDLYPDLTMTSEAFEQRIKYLIQHHHTFITLADLDIMPLTEISKPTILYFDDGFRDNVINALPILKKYGIRAVFFLTTGLINRTHLMWSIKHRLFLRQKGVAPEAIEREIHWLRKHNTVGRPAGLEALYQREKFDPDLEKLPLFLSWPEVSILVQASMEIGSHSVTHPHLTQLSDTELRSELEVSKQELTTRLGVTPVSLSFPHGRYNNSVISAAREVGYHNLVSIGVGLNSLKQLTSQPRLLSNVLTRPGDSLKDFQVNVYAAHWLRRLK